MYLYIFDSGEIRRSDDPPWPGDLEAIRLGRLRVIRFGESRFGGGLAEECRSEDSWISVSDDLKRGSGSGAGGLHFCA